MKHVISKVCAFLMSLTLLVGLMPTVEAEAYTNTAGTIRINNVTDGDKMKAYKIVQVDYVESTNTVTYSWVGGDSGDIANAIKTANTNTALSVKDFAAKTSSEQRTLLAALPALISQGEITQYGEEQTASDMNETVTTSTADGSVQWDNVPLGGYLIVPTSTTDVYQMMLAVVQPTTNANGVYSETISDTIAAKKNAVGIDKTVDNETTGDAQIITYTILADVPVYGEGATDKTYIIADKLGDGLRFTGDETGGKFEVYGYTVSKDNSSFSSATATELATVLEDNAYIDNHQKDEPLNTGEENQTFYLEFNYDKLKTTTGEQFKTIKIVYTAKVDTDTVLGEKDAGGNNTGNPNTATMKYTHYPFTDGNYKTTTDTESVYTFGLEIFKHKTGDETTPLSGAKFDVYLEVELNMDNSLVDTTLDKTKLVCTGNSPTIYTNSTISALPQNKNYVKLSLTSELVTGTDGKASLSRLDAGTYQLVETVAPSGYSLPSNAFEVTIAKGSSDTNYSQTTGVYTKKIENSTSFVLPETGGTGTAVFTIVGISLMLAAVIVFFVLRRKEANKK